MEAKRNLKFCRVCLVPEDNENFKSIFEENGKIATKIFNISSTIAVDVFDDCPAVICSSCLREVEESDALRQRILDANDHYQSLSASREAEMFKANLLELKKIINNKENADCQEQPQNNNNELKKFFVPNVYLNRQIKNEPESLLMAHLLKKSQPSTVKPTKSVLPMISHKHVKPFFKVSPTRPTRSVVPKTPPKETPTKVKTRRRESILSMKIKRLMSDVNTKSPVKKKVPELKAKAQPVIRALLKPQTKPDQTQRLVKILLKPVIKEQTSESAQRKQVEEQTKVERRLGGKTTSEVMQSRSIEGNKRRTKMFTLPCRRKRDPGVKIVTCFECDTCKRTFKSSLELNSHIESHELLFDEFLNLFETAVSDSGSCHDTADELSLIRGSASASVQGDISSSHDDMSVINGDVLMQEEEDSLLEEVIPENEPLVEEISCPMQVDTDEIVFFTVRELPSVPYDFN